VEAPRQRRELHAERFGYVLGDKPMPEPQPSGFGYEDDGAWLDGQELYGSTFYGEEQHDSTGPHFD
jgi:hypothetical protein